MAILKFDELTEVEVRDATPVPHGHVPQPPFGYQLDRVTLNQSQLVYDNADSGPATYRASLFWVRFPLGTPREERIKVLDSLVDLCNIRWGAP